MQTEKNELLATNEPVVMSSEIAEELDLETPEDTTETETTETAAAAPVVEIEFPEDLLTNETYINGINELSSKVDPLSVQDEVYYIDSPAMYAAGEMELPDHAVVYQANGIDVVFPTDYADNISVVDGLLINLDSSYTAGAQIDGYSVNNYLSSEITIPTYHSATWYQYLQSYGQPYRIVDRYVNSNGYISSSTRDNVSLEWSGGNPWEGFTFDRTVLFIIMALIAIFFFFRKGS